jgi:hypothetical protein
MQWVKPGESQDKKRRGGDPSASDHVHVHEEENKTRDGEEQVDRLEPFFIEEETGSGKGDSCEATDLRIEFH